MHHRVLVSDFDGTMTRNDFYKLAAARLLPATALEFWQAYREGRMTHFEALRQIFSQIRTPVAELEALIHEMGLDASLARDIARLREAGWQIVVTSAGCAWYIDRLLTWAGLNIGPHGDLEVYANPGEYSERTGLVMAMPEDARFRSPELGVNKAGIVGHYRARGFQVAYAGDGWADLDAALGVAPELRFARADLAQALGEQEEPFHLFHTWSDIVPVLLSLEPCI